MSLKQEWLASATCNGAHTSTGFPVAAATSWHHDAAMARVHLRKSDDHLRVVSRLWEAVERSLGYTDHGTREASAVPFILALAL